MAKSRARKKPAGKSGAASKKKTAALNAPGRASGKKTNGAERTLRGLLLPGLGGDKRMFEPILRHWIGPAVEWDVFRNEVPLIGDELPAYAARNYKAQGHKKQYDIAMAASFGGMICQEALRQGLLKARLVILISTALRGEDLGLGGRLSSFFLGLVPGFLGGIVKAVFVFSYPFVRFTMKEGRDFAAMFNDQPAALLFRVPRMIRRWKGGLPYAGTGSILHFQGTSDPLISYASVSGQQVPDYPIHKGSHLIFVTHAKWMAEEIGSVLGRTA